VAYSYLYPIDVPGDPSEKTGKVCAAIDLYEVIEAISRVKTADEWIVLGSAEREIIFLESSIHLLKIIENLFLKRCMKMYFVI